MKNSKLKNPDNTGKEYNMKNLSKCYFMCEGAVYSSITALAKQFDRTPFGLYNRMRTLTMKKIWANGGVFIYKNTYIYIKRNSETPSETFENS